MFDLNQLDPKTCAILPLDCQIGIIDFVKGLA